jgi:hypothetical protein
VGNDVRDLTLALLSARAVGATVCPSEVARGLVDAGDADVGPADWRSVMPSVHAAIDELVDEGAVRLSWKGKSLLTRSGPYRIGRNIEAN